MRCTRSRHNILTLELVAQSFSYNDYRLTVPNISHVVSDCKRYGELGGNREGPDVHGVNFCRHPCAVIVDSG